MVLIVISAVAFSSNNEQKTNIENSSLWQNGTGFISFVLTGAEKLATLNFNKNIVVSDNLQIDEGFKESVLNQAGDFDFKGAFNSVKNEVGADSTVLSPEALESNNLWNDFLAKIKEEWAKQANE
jgi:hypothetical protein